MKAERKMLGMSSLLALVRNEFNQFKEPSPSSSYPLVDCLSSALAMFNLKMPSLLQFTEGFKSGALPNNLLKLFNITAVPSDTHLRVRLDDVAPSPMQYIYDVLIKELQRSQVLSDFQYYQDYYLLALDGTGYFNSNIIHCNNCCVKQHKDGKVSYYHQALSAVLLHPHIKSVFPLSMEPIIRSDGNAKNDCERNASKRLLVRLRTSHPNLKLVIVMDALYANAPIIKLLNELDLRYIITGKNLAHMYDQFKHGGKMQTRIAKAGHILSEYKFANTLELNETNPELKVNYIEYLESGGKKSFFNSWITDIFLSTDDINKIVLCARARWHIENETFNTLKNQGYHFEHNYGHGYKNLSVVLCHLMFIAFLIDQIQAYCGYHFKQMKLQVKNYIWEKLRNIFTTVVVDSWEEFYHMVIILYTGKAKLAVVKSP